MQLADLGKPTAGPVYIPGNVSFPSGTEVITMLASSVMVFLSGGPLTTAGFQMICSVVLVDALTVAVTAMASPEV